MIKKIVAGLIAIVIMYFVCCGSVIYTGSDISIEAGEIYKKEIINGAVQNELYGFEYVPTRYRIYICNEVERNGRIYKKKKFYDVTGEIYSRYAVGDWFDSQNPRNTGTSENSEEVSGGKEKIESAN